MASTLLKLHTVLCSAPYSAVYAAPEVSFVRKECKFLIVYYIENGSPRKFQCGLTELLCSIGSCVHY